MLFWSSDIWICRYVITRSECEMRHRYGLDQLNTQIMTLCPPYIHTRARTHTRTQAWQEPITSKLPSVWIVLR
jgi:hypothetical protein